jgi:hypothetical protein
MTKQDMTHNSSQPVRVLNPAVRTTTSVNGTSVDLAGYEGAKVHIHGGLWIAATVTLTIRESDDDVTFTDVAAADLEFTADSVVSSTGTFVIKDAATDNLSRTIGYAGYKRYVNVNSTTTTATAADATSVGVDVVRGFKVLKGKLNQ